MLLLLSAMLKREPEITKTKTLLAFEVTTKNLLSPLAPHLPHHHHKYHQVESEISAELNSQ